MNTKAIALTFVLGISTFLSAWQPVEAARRAGTTLAEENTTEIKPEYLAQRYDRDRDRYGRDRDRDRYGRDRDRDRDRYGRDRDRGRYRGR